MFSKLNSNSNLNKNFDLNGYEWQMEILIMHIIHLWKVYFLKQTLKYWLKLWLLNRYYHFTFEAETPRQNLMNELAWIK